MVTIKELTIKFDTKEERVIKDLFNILNNDYCTEHKCDNCLFYDRSCVWKDFKNTLQKISNL